jgi:hypothetical protein
MQLLQSLSLFFRNSVSGLAKQGVYEETTTHTDLAVNAPHGEMNSASLERLAPGEYVLVNAIDESAIEIE